MTKQRKKEAVIPAQAGIKAVPAQQADLLLADIIYHQTEIDRITAAFNEAVADLQTKYEAKVEISKISLEGAQIGLMQVMKFEKKILFDGTDIVNLPHGSLIHAIVDKVKIPKTALATCEKLGFSEVVKIAKSLDRDAIEKWSDEKLVLIGAERRPKEEFSYDLKKEAKP